MVCVWGGRGVCICVVCTYVCECNDRLENNLQTKVCSLLLFAKQTLRKITESVCVCIYIYICVCVCVLGEGLACVCGRQECGWVCWCTCMN